MSHDEFMDIDGPEFISSVNQEIESIRANTRNDGTSTDLFDTRVGADRMPLESYHELCVLDTNFLISKLGYLDTILTLSEQNPGSLIVILPWVVIRELDGLKGSRHGKTESEIAVRARKAMRFIELRLREKSISIRGQKMNENLHQTLNAKGDDMILDCCIYFQHMTGRKVTLLSNDRNLCIKVMVHDIESISAESVPKMEALLNRIGGTRIVSLPLPPPATAALQRQQQPQPAAATTTTTTNNNNNITNIDDYVMEIDEFYPIEEDYDMMIDDDDIIHSPLPLKGTKDSQWAKLDHKNSKKKSSTKPEKPYLDNDPTLVAPKKPPQKNLTYSNSNYVPINKDLSWTSIYSPR